MWQGDRQRLKSEVDRLLAPLVEALAARGVRADHLSVAGCVIALAAGPALLTGQPVLAGLLFLVGGAFDGLDGALARTTTPTPFGALLDSTLDRVADGALLLAVTVHYVLLDNSVLALVSGVALVASFLTSYIRARGEALGLTLSEGWFTRLERILVLGIGLLFGVLALAICVVAVLATLTSVQRLILARQALRPGN